MDTFRENEPSPVADVRKSVTLIVPLWNEMEMVGPFYDRVSKIIESLAESISFEMLFVNDGSSDATETCVMKLVEADPNVSLINLSRNFGKEAALAAGIDKATGDAIIPIDVDLQDPPEVIPDMISLWQQGAHIVNARRIKRNTDSWIKRFTATAFYRVFNVAAEHPIPRNVGDFRLLDREVVTVLRQFGEHSRFNKALFSWVGFETREVTYERPARAGGETGWTYWKLWQLALDGIFASSTLPLRVWTYLGSFLALLSLVYSLFILVSTLVYGNDTPGYASTVILILFFGGMNMFALGIIGEYVGRIYIETRQRPLYVVRSFVNIAGDRSDGS